MKKYFLILFLFSSEAFSKSFSDRLYDRQVVKQRERYSLSDLIFRRSKVKLSDQFFSSNKNKSWFENLLSAGGSQDGLIKAQFQAAVFVKWLGIEGSQSENVDGMEKNVGLNLRLLGSSQQNSRINLIYGSLNDGSEDFQLIGAELGIYIFNQLGVSHRYERLIGRELSFDQTISEVFFEYGAFRIFSRWVESRSKGGVMGLTFFF